MSGGRFEKMFLGVILMSGLVTGLWIWSDALFTTYDVTIGQEANISFINNTQAMSENLKSLYEDVTHVPSNLLEWVEDTLKAGWGILVSIGSMFMFVVSLPSTIIHVIIPDATTANWIGGIMTALITSSLAWAFLAIFLRYKQGEI